MFQKICYRDLRSDHVSLQQGNMPGARLGVVIATVIHSCAGVGQHRWYEAFWSLHASLVWPIGQACHVHTHWRGTQILLKLAAVHLGQQLRVVHLLHAVCRVWVRVRRRGELSCPSRMPFRVAGTAVLGVIHGQRIWASHVGRGESGRLRGLLWSRGSMSLQDGVGVMVAVGVLGLVLCRLGVVCVCRYHVAIVLRMWREEHGVWLYSVQRRRVRCGEAVVFIRGAPKGLSIPVVTEWLWGKLKAVLMVAQAQTLHTHSSVCGHHRSLVIGHAMDQKARVQPLNPLHLLPPPGPVLVVGVILHVLNPQPLCLLHKGLLFCDGKGLPWFPCRSGGECTSVILQQIVCTAQWCTQK